MNPLFHTDFSISDSLKSVRKSVLIYETIIHPDTGTLLEGVLPNWDHIKDGVLKVSKQIPQLEYLGFDIAITKNGFKILEINIHQDLHKACEFTKDMNKFFAEKIEYKKRLYHI